MASSVSNQRVRVMGWIVAIAVLLSGCGPPQAEDVLYDYSERVHNALELDAPAPHQHNLPTYPRRRDLRLEQSDFRIGLLDLVSLDRCGLEKLVAERNSALGKVMPASQQLLYEHRLLGLARACADTLRARADPDVDLLKTLDEIVETKEKDLPHFYWNAIFAGPEMAEHLSLAVSLLPLEATVSVRDQLEALYYLRDLRPGLGHVSIAFTSEKLEDHFYALNNGHYGGRLLLSMDELAHHLQRIADVLDERQQQRPLCPQGIPTPRAEVLNTIFMKFYLETVQPYMARVYQEGSAWTDAMDELIVRQENVPTAFRTYHDRALSSDHPDGPWQRFSSALDDHTRAWQTLFSSCGMQPTVTDR